ncbi:MULTISPECIES: hypothetical protein [unclassified Diaminobutyricimonas]|uniref:hypothetical protein n=1 Tax=unclassified Diaminobutyricimonas TaxID=2643261 RepID=UPI0012F4A893|nr:MULTISPECIES: hypothetical protein [unclassified Diaminobutyricimonas]
MEQPASASERLAPRARRPLTERILDRLPGPNWSWAATWALVPWLNLLVVVALGVTDDPAGLRPVDILNRAAVSVAILLSIWGAARIEADLNRVRAIPVVAAHITDTGADRVFSALGNAIVPLVTTVVIALVLPSDELVAGSPGGALVQGVTWLVIGIPMCTAAWAYLVLQVGLGRLGDIPLTYDGDRSLGLQPIGGIAFTGFLMLAGILGPLLLTGVTDLSAVLVSSAVLLAGVITFFLSLHKLHRRMVAVKRRELARVLALYRDAYERVQGPLTPEELQHNVGLLTAAETLEKRAERIYQWPFEEGMLARVVTIASGVIGVIIARLLLAPAGL